MRDREEIFQIIRTNEEIARKFLKIESLIPTFVNVKELFEKLVEYQEREFNIPFVWVSIIRRKELEGITRLLCSSPILKDRISIVDENVFLELLSHRASPLLVNNNLKPFYRLLPKKRKFLIRSLAVAPICLNTSIVGSFNYGDFSPLRYHPDMDTSLLEKLTGRISSTLTVLMHDIHDCSDREGT